MKGLVALALVAGCGVPDLSTPKPGDRLTVELQGEWNSDERAAIAKSYDLWREASHGKIDVYVASSDDADASLAREALASSAHGQYSDFSRAGRWMRIDADALARDGFDPSSVGALAGGMVGAMLGIPQHDGTGMRSRGDVTLEVSPEDLEACRAAGFC